MDRHGNLLGISECVSLVHYPINRTLILCHNYPINKCWGLPTSKSKFLVLVLTRSLNSPAVFTVGFSHESLTLVIEESDKTLLCSIGGCQLELVYIAIYIAIDTSNRWPSYPTYLSLGGSAPSRYVAETRYVWTDHVGPNEPLPVLGYPLDICYIAKPWHICR